MVLPVQRQRRRRPHRPLTVRAKVEASGNGCTKVRAPRPDDDVEAILIVALQLHLRMCRLPSTVNRFDFVRADDVQRVNLVALHNGEE